MSPLSCWFRSVAPGLRVTLATVLILAMVGVCLPSALVAAAPGRLALQQDPEQPPQPETTDDPGEASHPPAAEPPRATEPPATEPPLPPVELPPVELPPVEPAAPVRQESAPPAPEPAPVEVPESVAPEPSPTPPPSPSPDPTPEPWGAARVRLYDPLVAPVVPAGSEATYVLEVAHLGAGGPDAKEIWAEAPAGWDVRFAPGASGEVLTDNDGDGRPETRPLFVNDWTYVAVIITTPASLTATSSAAIRVTATSFGLDQDAFRSWIDLSVTAVVPEPTPPPTVKPDPSPSDSSSPSSSASEVVPDGSASAEASTDGQTSPSPGASDDADGTASDSAAPSGSLSDSASPSGSANPDASGSESASASASPSASATESMSPSASPSPEILVSDPTIVSVPDVGPLSPVPGETMVVRHGFTVGGIANDETVTLSVLVAIDPGWSVSVEDEKGIDEQSHGDGFAELSMDVTGSQAVGLIVRIAVPDDVAGGTTASLSVSATVTQHDDVLAAQDVSSDIALDILAVSEADTAASADPAGLAPAVPVSDDVDGPGEAGFSYTLVVESVAALSVEGGATFGTVNVLGDIDPTTSGVTSTADDNGATYTQAGAVTLIVSGLAGPWSISCGALASSSAGSASTSPYEWRLVGGGWQAFPNGDETCISGDGPATVVIDIRLRIEWGGEPGTRVLEVRFTLHNDGIGAARSILI